MRQSYFRIKNTSRREGSLINNHISVNGESLETFNNANAIYLQKGEKMKVKINNPFFGMMDVYPAEITAKSDIQCGEIPVILLVGGMSVTPQEATLAEYQYLEVSDGELISLQKAGYLM